MGRASGIQHVRLWWGKPEGQIPLKRIDVEGREHNIKRNINEQDWMV